MSMHYVYLVVKAAIFGVEHVDGADVAVTGPNSEPLLAIFLRLPCSAVVEAL